MAIQFFRHTEVLHPGDALTPDELLFIQELAARANYDAENVALISDLSGLNIETPTGTVNGTNAVFTVSNEPIFIATDGMARFAGLDYSYSGGTITMQPGNEPNVSIRSFY